MKTKNLDKKMVLKKSTIANLNKGQMQALHGKSDRPECALTDDDKTCLIKICTFTVNDDTCPITACLTGVWC